MALRRAQVGHGEADTIAGMVGVTYGFREAGEGHRVVELAGCREGTTIAERAGAIVAVTGDSCSRRGKREPEWFALAFRAFVAMV